LELFKLANRVRLKALFRSYKSDGPVFEVELTPGTSRFRGERWKHEIVGKHSGFIFGAWHDILISGLRLSSEKIRTAVEQSRRGPYTWVETWFTCRIVVIEGSKVDSKPYIAEARSGRRRLIRFVIGDARHLEKLATEVPLTGRVRSSATSKVFRELPLRLVVDEAGRPGLLTPAGTNVLVHGLTEADEGLRWHRKA
jgi:hypothetical protein